MANQQGWNEQTPAVKSMLAGAVGTARRAASGGSRKRRKAARASGAKRSARRSSKRARSTKRAKKGRAKLVAGSAAAKAWGRKMKALRKK